MRAQGDFREKQYELTEIQASLDSYMAAADEKETLQAEVDARKETRDLILESYQGLDIQGSNMSDLFQMVERIIPPGIDLTLLYQNDGQLHLEGEAETYDTVLDLFDTLALRDELSEVYIYSADQIADEEGETTIIINDEGESVIVPDRFTFVIYATVVEEGLR
jgi:Tfp pilus assembly protein PilN